MKSLPVSRRKFLFALCIIFGLATHTSQISAAYEKTDDIICELNNQEATPEIEQYREILAKITEALREFVHELSNNKKLNQYLKEFAKLTKELGDMAKRNHESGSTRHRSLHKRLYTVHKGLHEFIAVIKAHETSPIKIGLELLQRKELRNVIPEQAAGWKDIRDILDALNVRCKQ